MISCITLKFYLFLPFAPTFTVGVFNWEKMTMPKKELIDVVYVLKPELESEELRYSLRSVEKNFPCRKVWFVGGQPKGFVPDARLEHKQEGNSKWNLIKSSMWAVINCDEITDNFFWFNDDFFVMKPIDTKKFVNFVDGTLERRIQELHSESGMNPYTRTLFKAQQELMSLKMPTMNYDVHLPMLFNKTLAENSINRCSSPQMRSIYGNINQIKYKVFPDVKVYDLESVPDYDYLSTNEKTFNNGKVGEYIRETFTEPSRFEVS